MQCQIPTITKVKRLRVTIAGNMGYNLVGFMGNIYGTSSSSLIHQEPKYIYKVRLNTPRSGERDLKKSRQTGSFRCHPKVIVLCKKLLPPLRHFNPITVVIRKHVYKTSVSLNGSWRKGAESQPADHFILMS